MVKTILQSSCRPASKQPSQSSSQTESQDQEKISIHPALDPFLTDNYFCKYAGLHETFTQNVVFRKSLIAVHKMSNPRGVEPYLSSGFENSLTAQEIIEAEFVKSCYVDSKNQHENLVKVVRDCLTAEGFDERKISSVIQRLDPDISGHTYDKRFRNGTAVKALGFPNYKAFQGFYDEMTDPTNSRNNNRRYEIDVTPQHILANVTYLDSLQNDQSRRQFLADLTAFQNRACIPDHVNRDVRVMAKTQGAFEVLAVIQANVKLLVRNFLGSEQNLKTMSLKEYSCREESFFKLGFQPKQITKIKRLIDTANSPIDMVQNDHDLAMGFSCFKCPSSAFPPDVQTTSKIIDMADPTEFQGKGLNFVKKARESFNVFRGEILLTRQDVQKHNWNIHSIAGPEIIAKLGDHVNLYRCKFCDGLTIDHSFCCCLEHLASHMAILHSEQILHLRIWHGFKAAFKDNTFVLNICERYLFSFCLLCHAYFENKEQV